MKKNKKLILTIIFAVLAAGIITAVILIANQVKKNQEEEAAPDVVKDFNTLDEAMAHAGFKMRHSDRLAGMPVSGFKGSQRSIIVLFEGAGSISKTLILEPDEGAESTESAAPEGTAHVIDGMTVWFAGAEGRITSARWTDNGFDYVISLDGGGGAVTEEEMADYVQMTR